MRTITLLIFNAVFAAAALLAWPIYQHPSFLVLVVVSLVLANTLALFGVRRSWSPLRLTLVTAGVYLVIGVPLAIPSALVDPLTVVVGFGRLLIAPVTSWKDLLTLSLPVGSYQTVLVPALLVFLIAPVAALSVALRSKKLWGSAVGIAALPMVFASTFGSSATSAGLSVLFFSFPAPLETVLTLGSILALLVWMWLRRRSTVSGTVRGQAVPMLGVIAAGTVVSLLIVPTLMSQTPRDVLRVQIDPELQLQNEVSPLSTYRAFFDDELFATDLFQVSGGSDVDRVRIATLSGFDGQVATVDSAASAASAATASAVQDAFARVPSVLAGASAAQRNSLTVQIDALHGIWMPTVADLRAVTFTGERRTALSDGFFYNRSLDAGIQLADAGLTSGDAYTLQGGRQTAAKLADLKPGLTQPRFDSSVIPESLQDWIALQKVPRSGAGLETLIERLRARGYLSHALSIDKENTPQWVQALPGYSFEPSRAGHSSARIDQLFTELRDREREVGGQSDEALVAAVGDDEQFSVAAMLLADQLGFNARVVLGTALQGDAGCAGGTCAGENMRAWLEVQGDNGQWVAVDVTPQYEHPIAPDVDRIQDPQVVTEVQPPKVDSVQPPESAPSQNDSSSDDDPFAGLDLTWLWVTLRVLGLSLFTLFVLAGPFLLIWLLKRLRRRNRRQSPEPKESIIGAWNEYVDTAVDFGNDAPSYLTRLELVALHANQQPSQSDIALAEGVDRAVFSAEPPSREQSEALWQLVDVRTSEFTAAADRRRRILAMFSLRSFLRWARRGAR